MVSMVTWNAAEAGPWLPAASVARRRELVGAVRQRVGVGQAPVAVDVGHRRADRHAVLEDLDRAARLGRAAQRQRRVVGEVVARRPAVVRERRDRRRPRRRRVDDDVERRRGRPLVARRRPSPAPSAYERPRPAPRS